MGKHKRKPGDTEKRVRAKIDDFISEVQTKNRSIEKHTVLTWLNGLAKDGLVDTKIDAGAIVYRARLIKNKDKLNGRSPFEGFDGSDSKQPPKEKTLAMRANYEYIPYLYCSSTAYGAMSEIRPYINAKISLAEIQLNKPLRCLDLCYVWNETCEDESSYVEKNISFITQLSNMFQKPVEYGENAHDYYPTQRIAEYIKNLGYDAIIYKSALDSNALNYCIFNYEKCDVISTRVYTTQGLTYDFIGDENSKQIKLDTCGKVEELAAKIYKSICGEDLVQNLTTVAKLKEVLIKITGKTE